MKNKLLDFFNKFYKNSSIIFFIHDDVNALVSVDWKFYAVQKYLFYKKFTELKRSINTNFLLIWVFFDFNKL